MISLHNTLSNKKEVFEPLSKGEVKMYHCGPTVYGRQHIGNLSMFVFTDILRRTLEYFGYKVEQVINITDFGHLVSDGDEGEDKMTKGLRSEGLEVNMENMKAFARRNALIFLSDIKEFNIRTHDTKFPYASEYVEEQKKLIEKLEDNGFTYKISDGIYFDTSKFPDYGRLGNIVEGDESRIGENIEKKNQKDFALWKFDKILGWDSKWGQGFPGWHIECTAMIFELLGEQIDIHTGGIEHIGVHHNNEIAQAEAASGKSPFSKFWLHREHIKINDQKIAKSVGNTLYLDDFKEHKIHPLSYRYWLLTGSYKTPMNFTWEAVDGAQVALEKIVTRYIDLPQNKKYDMSIAGNKIGSDEIKDSDIRLFEEYISDNLNTALAISLLQQAIDKDTIENMDEVLGLNIKKLSEQIREIPDEIRDLEREREEARKKEDWRKSDDLRDQIESRGFRVNDTAKNSLILRSLSSLV